MQKRPSIKALILESHRFVWENRDWAIYYFQPLLIPVVVLTLLSGIGGHYSNAFKISELVTIYFSACFILSWHRAFLMGPRAEHKVSPFALNPGEGKFIASVYLLGLAPFLLIVFAFILVLLGKAVAGGPGVLITGILGVPFIIYGLIRISRWFFIFPAKSMNTDITLKEASNISKGVLMPFLLAAFLIGFGVTLAIVVPAGLAGAIMGVFIDPKSLAFAVLASVLIALPSVAVGYYIMALNVGILSRLYQWAVQERG